jgi:hypothetical protein
LINFFRLNSSVFTSIGVPLFFQIKSATSHSIFSFQIIKPQSIQRIIHEITYITVTFNPNNHKNIATATSLIRGEVIRNVKVIPSGIQAFKKPTNIGILEQLQNGVTAPKNEERR